jgi:hypothetical protein
MSGHVDDAADALTAAADEVPVEAATSADQQLAAMLESLQDIGGARGERLIQLTLVMQEEGRRIAAELATLRQPARTRPSRPRSHRRNQPSKPETAPATQPPPNGAPTSCLAVSAKVSVATRPTGM